MQNIAIIKQGTGRYLFSVPENVTLLEGDRVKCSTKRGVTDGIAFADSAWVDENVSQLIGKLTGAKFPLKSVVGRLEYLPFDKPQDNPANKYGGMSNDELDREMCAKKGMCLATDSGGRRKRDCPFAGKCNYRWVTDADRAEVIEYLLSEDAEAAPKPKDKPTEDKPEPIKLYCVKDYRPGRWCTKGKIYEIGADGSITHDSGWKESDFMHFMQHGGRICGSGTEWAKHLVPLVARPAKVGEYILLTNLQGCHIPDCEEGEVVKIDSLCKGKAASDRGNCWSPKEYLVLDGYRPEPEAEPEYWSGKVVCVSSGDEYFAVGKMYEFVNGEIKDDDGDVRPMLAGQQFKSVDEWNSEYGMPIARFIEFKGEAHD